MHALARVLSWFYRLASYGTPACCTVPSVFSVRGEEGGIVLSRVDDCGMSDRIYWAKGVAGLLCFALAPVYCVWSLRAQNIAGTLQKPSRQSLDRSFEK